MRTFYAQKESKNLQCCFGLLC